MWQEQDNDMKNTDKIMGRVLQAFSIEELKIAVCLNEKSLSKYIHSMPKTERPLFYKNNNSLVLGVAHLDSVQKSNFCELLKHPNGSIVFCPKADDRIGVYTLLFLLPKLGIKTDILLTVDEEQGKSSGRFFTTDKKYNWMFMFDRSGNDIVHYQYSGKEWESAWEDDAGFSSVSYGSYSCIKELESLQCKGVNIGSGYDDHHSIMAKIKLDEYFTNVVRFIKFYYKHQHNHFPHEKQERYNCNYRGWDDRTEWWNNDEEEATYTTSSALIRADGRWNDYRKQTKNATLLENKYDSTGKALWIKDGKTMTYNSMHGIFEEYVEKSKTIKTPTVINMVAGNNHDYECYVGHQGNFSFRPFSKWLSTTKRLKQIQEMVKYLKDGQYMVIGDNLKFTNANVKCNQCDSILDYWDFSWLMLCPHCGGQQDVLYPK